MNSDLKSNLEKSNAGLASRNQLRIAVVKSDFELTELINLATDLSYTNHHKAIWIIEQIAMYDRALLIPYVSLIVEKAPHYRHTSAVRGLSKILYLFSIAPEIKLDILQKRKITETALDWLIGTQKVACKANAIKIIAHFAAEFPEIVDPFLELMEKDFGQQTAGFKAASRNALKVLKR